MSISESCQDKSLVVVQERDGYRVEGRLGQPGQQVVLTQHGEGIPLPKELALRLTLWCNLLDGARQAVIGVR